MTETLHKGFQVFKRASRCMCVHTKYKLKKDSGDQVPQTTHLQIRKPRLREITSIYHNVKG